MLPVSSPPGSHLSNCLPHPDFYFLGDLLSATDTGNGAQLQSTVYTRSGRPSGSKIDSTEPKIFENLIIKYDLS